MEERGSIRFAEERQDIINEIDLILKNQRAQQVLVILGKPGNWNMEVWKELQTRWPDDPRITYRYDEPPSWKFVRPSSREFTLIVHLNIGDLSMNELIYQIYSYSSTPMHSWEDGKALRTPNLLLCSSQSSEFSGYDPIHNGLLEACLRSLCQQANVSFVGYHSTNFFSRNPSGISPEPAGESCGRSCKDAWTQTEGEGITPTRESNPAWPPGSSREMIEYSKSDPLTSFSRLVSPGTLKSSELTRSLSDLKMSVTEKDKDQAVSPTSLNRKPEYGGRFLPEPKTSSSDPSEIPSFCHPYPAGQDHGVNNQEPIENRNPAPSHASGKGLSFDPHRNYKGILQEHLVKIYRGSLDLEYVVKKEGRDHLPIFRVTLYILLVHTPTITVPILTFSGDSFSVKKEAEQHAAFMACLHYHLL